MVQHLVTLQYILSKKVASPHMQGNNICLPKLFVYKLIVLSVLRVYVLRVLHIHIRAGTTTEQECTEIEALFEVEDIQWLNMTCSVRTKTAKSGVSCSYSCRISATVCIIIYCMPCNFTILSWLKSLRVVFSLSADELQLLCQIK